jgi:hypothetical protein
MAMSARSSSGKSCKSWNGEKEEERDIERGSGEGERGKASRKERKREREHLTNVKRTMSTYQCGYHIVCCNRVVAGGHLLKVVKCILM